MEIKNVKLGLVKAGEKADLKEGEMIAYASIFGNTDSYGDRVLKGAFEATLKAWKDSGNSIPFLYGHDMSNPDMNIGTVIEAMEDEKGLRIRVKFDDDPTAQKVYRLIKAGRLNELSFAFDVVKSAFIEDPDDPKAIRELQEVKIYECSAVPIGANSETSVVAIKSNAEAIVDGIKAGRSLSAKNEASLRDALASVITVKEALESVLPAVDDDEDEDADDVEDDDTDGKSAVKSDMTHGKASDEHPLLGDEVVDRLVQKMGETFGLTLPSAAGADAPAPVVSDLEMELDLISLDAPE